MKQSNIIRDKINQTAHKSINKIKTLTTNSPRRQYLRWGSIFIIALLLGITSMQLTRQYWGATNAASANITVTDNNQTISTNRQTSTTTITRTSTVKVTDSTATNGYDLTAKLTTSTLAGATVTIGSSSSSQCTLAAPCNLNGTAQNILITSSSAATGSGETTVFTVTMTLPASPAVGTYTIDIEYSEAAHAAPSITGTSPSGAQPQGTTSVTLSATTNINSTCKYSTLDQAYNDMPSTMSGTTTSHTASVAVTANTNYTYYVRCQSSYGATMTSSSTISFSIPAAGLTSGSNMQSATTALCNATTAGTTVNLTDTRDGKVYRVRKMADNRCWMIDNLAFDLANANAPAYNPTEQLVSGTTTSVNTMAQYFLNSAYDTAAGADTYLYNWCAAMGDDSTDCLVTRLYSSGQPTIPVTGICPAPFRLPIGGSAATNSDTSTTKNEFAKLDIAMGGTGTNRDNANTYSNWMGTDASSSAWGGVFSSHVGSSGAIGSAGPRGFWWSSSGYTSTGDGVPTANVLQLMSSGNRVDPVQAYEKRLGFAVRCVL